MLFLLFSLGEDRCAIDANRVVEIVPLVPLVPLVAGINPASVVGDGLDFRGQAVPVVDLVQVTNGRSVRQALSSRILIVRPGATPNAGEGDLLGLAVEKLTGTLTCSPDEFVASRLQLEATAFLAATRTTPEGIVYRIDPDLLRLSRSEASVKAGGLWDEVMS